MQWCFRTVGFTRMLIILMIVLACADAAGCMTRHSAVRSVRAPVSKPAPVDEPLECPVDPHVIVKDIWPWPTNAVTPLLSGKEDWGAPPEKAGNAISATLPARFIASAQPLTDTQLMREAVTGSTEALVQVARSVNSKQQPQLDALAALAAYLEAHEAAFSRTNANESLYMELGKRAAPEMAPQVLRWMGDASLKSQREYQLELLARCGGPEAKRALDMLYDAGQAKRHLQAAPPYALTKSDMQRIGRQLGGANPGLWAEADAGGTTKYAVFAAGGMLCRRDLFLAVGRNGSEQWDELLPTGIIDFSSDDLDFFPVRKVLPQDQLALAADEHGVHITYRKAADQPATHGKHVIEKTGPLNAYAERVTTTLSLSDLRHDADHDGLTDITERMLMINPAKPDTHGDGLKDIEDPTPLANPAEMGKVERGIFRALKFDLERDVLRNEMHRGIYWFPILQPYQATYFFMYGCGPVAYCIEPQQYNICLHSPKLRKAYMDALQDYPAGHIVRVSCWRKGMTRKQELAASQFMEMVKEPGGETSAIAYMIEKRKRVHDDTVAMEVYIDFPGGGSVVRLIKVEGEYFPVSRDATWIA
jgi:hypothetical protein